MAILAGIFIPAVPYALFVVMVERLGEDYFHLHPQFVAIILGLVLLCLGGNTTGIILGKGKFNTLQKYHFVLVAPGLYLGLAGFVTNFLVDEKIPKDGVIALSILNLALTTGNTSFAS